MASGGEEDCFVVARNKRSAAKLHADYCGFEPNELLVEQVASLLATIVRSFHKRQTKKGKAKLEPWYTDDELLEDIGAEFREIDGKTETLVNEVVYTTNSGYTVPPRMIGERFLRDLKSQSWYQEYGDEDVYDERQQLLMTMLGICVARCQEIEHLICHSFIFAVSDRKENEDRTINDLRAEWKKKTLGQLFRIIDRGYEIQPEVRQSLELFLKMRNELVHGITTSDKYDIHTSWGQDELVAFLAFFEFMSRPIRKAFRASLYASIDFANTFMVNGSEEGLELTEEEKEEAGLFAAFFTVKQGDDGASA